MAPAARRHLVVAMAAALAVIALASLVVARFAAPRPTARAGRTEVTVRTPFVAPGDPIALELRVLGVHAAIHEVTVRAGDELLRVAGRGEPWAHRFRPRDAAPVGGHLGLAVEVRPDAEPGTSLSLAIEVSASAAETRGGNHNAVVVDRDVVALTVPIRSPSARDAARARTGLVALAALIVAMVVAGAGAWRAGAWWRRRPDRDARPRRPTPAVAVVVVAGVVLAMLAALIAYGFVGWGWFVPALVAATAVDVAPLGWLALAVWLASPLLAGRLAWTYRQRHAGR
ncbi:MAG TPA: hypothetical protein VM734_34990 [Kofleriaceae bacterium]|nr:hypothetical protein [Kofleriaceae bacterium]